VFAVIEYFRVLAWPFVVLFLVVLAIALPQGRSLLSELARNVSRIKGGGVEVELTAKRSSEVKQDLEKTISAFRKPIKQEFDRQANAEHIVEHLARIDKEVMHDALLKPEQGFRATVYVPDVLFKGLLYRLVDYYPRGGGRGKVYSMRFGIIGKTWRLEASDHATVSPDPERLIGEWGMTRPETKRSGSSAMTFVSIVLKDTAKIPVGVLFVESEAQDAFADDIIDRMERSDEVASLAKAVARVVRELRKAAQPPIAIFDE
jgi:hypothetical protein